MHMGDEWRIFGLPSVAAQDDEDDDLEARESDETDLVMEEEDATGVAVLLVVEAVVSGEHPPSHTALANSGDPVLDTASLSQVLASRISPDVVFGSDGPPSDDASRSEANLSLPERGKDSTSIPPTALRTAAAATVEGLNPTKSLSDAASST